MPDPNTQRAAARVAILARWRPADDPDLISARRLLAVARIEAKLAQASADLTLAGDQRRALDRTAER